MALAAEPLPVYADSSALVKLVIEERESDELERYILDRNPSFITSRTALVEVQRSVALARDDPVALGEAQRLVESCALVDVSEPVLRAAARIAPRELRSLDAIHLATALRVDAREMLAYDARLQDAATRAGLVVIAPGVRP